MAGTKIAAGVARPKRGRRHLEDAESVFLMQWAGRVRIDTYRHASFERHAVEPGSTIADYLFAIPNGGKRDPREAARLRAMGVKAGVSDYFLPIPTFEAAIGVRYAGLWVELKAGAGTPTDSQRKWVDRMTRAGYSARIAVGWPMAARAIVNYLGLPFEVAPER